MQNVTKDEVAKKVASFQLEHKPLLDEAGVFTDGEFQGELNKLIPKMKQDVAEELAYDRYSFGDPLKWMWELSYQMVLIKLQKQIKGAVDEMMARQLKIMSFAVVVIGVASFQLQFTSFEMVMIFLGVWCSLQFFENSKVLVKMEIEVRKLMSSADHVEFGSSNAAGNMVKITRSIFEKASYVEQRLMFLTADKGDVSRQLSQVVSEFWGYEVGNHKLQVTRYR